MRVTEGDEAVLWRGSGPTQTNFLCVSDYVMAVPKF